MNVDQLLRILGELDVVEKVARGDTWPQCQEIIGKTIEGAPFFIYIYKGRHSTETILRITPTPQDCVQALYTPNALYTIPLDKNKLKQSLTIKIKTTTKIHQQQPKQ